MQDWKIDHLNSLDSSLNIDVLAGCERNLELHQIDKHHQLLDLLIPRTSKCGIVAHNTMGDILHQAQHGGAMVTAFGRLCDAFCETDSAGLDLTKLGRWSWIHLGNGAMNMRIISAYIPNKPGNSKGEMVWD